MAEAIKLYDRGTTNNDVADLGRLVKDDYLLINSDGSAQNKRSYLADFAKPGFKIGRYELVQPFQIFAKDSALVGGILNLTWTQDGARFERRLRVVHFWVRQNGRWRLAYTQLTRDPRLPK